MPKVSGVLETAIYVDDVRRSVEFYKRVFDFPTLTSTPHFHALDVCGRQVLLIFEKGANLKPAPTSGGEIPPHHGDGNLHFAFAIEKETLAEWEAHLASVGVRIESRVTWPAGGTSLYFRDPDGHLAELATPGIWKTY